MNHGDIIHSFLAPCKEWTYKKYETEMILNADSAPKLLVKATGYPLTDHIMTWFMFQWINPETGITPAQEFARDHADGRDWEDAVKHMSRMEFGRFHILETRNDGTGRVRSLSTGNEHPAIFRVGHDKLSNGDIIIGYMHSWYGGTYVTTGTISVVESSHNDILSGLDRLYRNAVEEPRKRYESVPITHSTDIGAYLKSQRAPHVSNVAKSLGIKSRAKWKNIQDIQDILTGSGVIDVIKSLSPRHLKCLDVVAAAGGLMRRHTLETQMSDNTKIPRDLYNRGLLMFGAQTIRDKHYKVVGIPADILDNAVKRGLLKSGRA